MKFEAKEIAKYQNLEEFENEVFSEKEREDIRIRAEKRAKILRGDATITLDTLAAVSVLLGLTPQISLVE